MSEARTLLALHHQLLGMAAIVLGAWCGVAAEVTVIVREAGQSHFTPARLHLRTASGTVIKPEGLPSWNDHFVFQGKTRLALEAGQYHLEIERGPEYSANTMQLSVGESPTTVEVILNRLADMAGEGWWSGETHVHRPLAHVELLMQAEDLHVAQLMTWWNKANVWSNTPIPQGVPTRFDDRRFYHALSGEDERDAGALLFMDQQAPLPITGGTKHEPSSLGYAKMARERGSTGIDAEKPFWGGLSHVADYEFRSARAARAVCSRIRWATTASMSRWMAS